MKPPHTGKGEKGISAKSNTLTESYTEWETVHCMSAALNSKSHTHTNSNQPKSPYTMQPFFRPHKESRMFFASGFKVANALNSHTYWHDHTVCKGVRQCLHFHSQFSSLTRHCVCLLLYVTVITWFISDMCFWHSLTQCSMCLNQFKICSV